MSVRILFCIFLFLPSSIAVAQEVTLKGVVADSDGKRLPFATVPVLPDSVTTSANESGQFSVRTSRGRKEMVISYTGFEVVTREVLLRNDTSFTFIMFPRVLQLREVTDSTASRTVKGSGLFPGTIARATGLPFRFRISARNTTVSCS